MVSVSALLYELTADEVKSLPSGFMLLEVNMLYKNFRAFECGKHHVKRDGDIAYYSLKEPPATFCGTKTKRPKYKKAFASLGSVDDDQGTIPGNASPTVGEVRTSARPHGDAQRGEVSNGS